MEPFYAVSGVVKSSLCGNQCGGFFQYQDKVYCMTQLEVIDCWLFPWWTPNQHVRETLVRQQIYVFNTGGMDKDSVAYKHSGLMFQ